MKKNKNLQRLRKKNYLLGRAHIQSSQNNTIITIADLNGNTLLWSSAGSVGFKGSKRSTSYAAQAAAESVGRKAVQSGIVSVEVLLKGLGDGRESAVRGLLSAGLKVTLLKDVTPIPHNGCRLPKRRRI